MSLEEATWDSVNVVFAQLDLDVGPEAVTETAEEMGIETAAAVGTRRRRSAVSPPASRPLEMADGYATLANGGVHHDPTAISRVEFPNGKVDEIDSDKGERVLTPGQAYEVTKILEGVITQGTGAGYTYMGCTSEAGKTGTSEGESDAWFVGYTPLYSTAVWVGHPDSREATGFGGPTAGPIWRNYMESAQEGDCPEFEVPTSLPELSALSSEHTRSSAEVRQRRRRRRRRRAKQAARRSTRKPRQAKKKKQKKAKKPKPNRKRTPEPKPEGPWPRRPTVGGGVSPP